MDKIFYYYPRDKHGKRLGHSIAAIIKDDKVFFGFANLGFKDNFNRKIGRVIAESRAREQIKRYENRQKKVC
jgi:hypothetical protein